MDIFESPRPRSRTAPLAAIALIAALALPAMAHASHFRGGNASWVQTGTNTVELTFVSMWASSFIGSGSVTWGDGSAFSFSSGNATTIQYLTDTSGQSYAVMSHVRTHTYSGAGPWVVQHDSCCRIGGIQNNPGSYRIRTVVDMNGNTGSPVSAAPEIFQMVQGGVNTIPLPVSDPDGDPVTCSLTSDTYIGSQPAGLTVDPSTCVVTWNTSGTSVGQKWVFAVKLSDPSGSYTILDRIIEIVDGTLNSPPTCSGGGNYSIGAGQTLTVTFTGTDAESGLTAQILSPPPGSSFGPLSGASPLTSTFSWTPTAAQLGAYASSVIMSDSGNLQATCALGVTVICTDADGDGFCASNDCDDNNAAVNPAATEVCNGIDDNCVGGTDEGLDTDADNDGVNSLTSCNNPNDCDDNDAANFPGNAEVCDGQDNDCDFVVPEIEIDDDNDGQWECQGDCDDADADIFYGNPEVCDGKDNDCNGDADFTNATGGETDSDGDSLIDCADACPADPANDIDNDGVCGDVDNCPTTANSDQSDLDGDTEGDVCDICPLDADNDLDQDGICGDVDECPGTALDDWEAGVPSTGTLGSNRWMYDANLDVNGDGSFTQGASGNGKNQGNGAGNNGAAGYTLEDTAGCSCAQIIDELGLGNGHTKHGCSNSAMEDWTDLIGN